MTTEHSSQRDISGVFPDLSVDDSLREPLVVGSNDGAYPAKWFWFGKDYFSTLVKETVFRNDDGSESYQDCDVAFMTALKDYPILHCLERLTTQFGNSIPDPLTRNTSNSLAQLMTIIGAVIDRGDGNTKRQLATEVEGCISRREPEVDHWERLPASPTRPVNTEGRGNVPHETVGVNQNPRGPTKQVPMYTSKLHEWAQLNRRQIGYDYAVISDFNEWEARCTVDGIEFREVANQKQEAKHLASKSACEHFSIAI